MNDLKNIDRLFKEKFKEFEVDAPKNTWSAISNTMHSTHSVQSYLKYFKYTAYALATASITGVSLYMYSLSKQTRAFITPVNLVQQSVKTTLPNYVGEQLILKDKATYVIEVKKATKTNDFKAIKEIEPNKVNTENITENLSSTATVFKGDNNNIAKKVTTITLSQAEIEHYLKNVSDSNSLFITNNKALIDSTSNR